MCTWPQRRKLYFVPKKQKQTWGSSGVAVRSLTGKNNQYYEFIHKRSEALKNEVGTSEPSAANRPVKQGLLSIGTCRIGRAYSF